MRKKIIDRATRQRNATPRKKFPNYVGGLRNRDDPDVLNDATIVVINTIANNILKTKITS